MNISKLNDFIETENDRIKDASGQDGKELLRFYALKLGEEYGEFLKEFNRLNVWKRKDKIIDEVATEKAMAEELADVILVSLIIGRQLNIDVEEELSRKIDKLKTRKY
jgi:NTP pyrophosphatase (non-canonical NTP hydrolase)